MDKQLPLGNTVLPPGSLSACSYLDSAHSLVQTGLESLLHSEFSCNRLLDAKCRKCWIFGCLRRPKDDMLQFAGANVISPKSPRVDPDK